MRSKIDTKLQRRAKKPKSPVGGKALQRLFFYLSERDPALNNDVLATIEVPKVARPRFGLTKSAPRARRVVAPPFEVLKSIRWTLTVAPVEGAETDTDGK